MNQSTNSVVSRNDGEDRLPKPNTLRWAHSVCSKDGLKIALIDKEITAIEADIVMGHIEDEKTKDVSPITEPIMSHPPISVSDLSFTGFINKCMEDSKDCTRQQQKHLKLDFKDVESIDPALDTLQKSITENSTFEKSVFLNADILKGPGGRRIRQIPIEANTFMKKCLKFISLINEEDRKRIVMSLGWRVDCRSFYGYTDNDVKEMKDIIEKYDLMERTGGVVLALNARVLAKDPSPFESILKEFPKMQLLVWTGTGEPQISRSKISRIKDHFHKIEYKDRIGFDCQVASTEGSGMLYDNIVHFVGFFWNAKNSFFDENVSPEAGS